MATLGDLVVNIIANTAKFNGDIDKAKKAMVKFEDSAKKLGSNMTKYLTLPILAVGVASTKLASDLGESINAVNVVFGDSADIIKDWGETASEQAGLSRSAFNESSALIGTLLKKTGKSLNDVSLDTIEVTKRSADLASVFNKDLSVATNAVASALRGETEPIRQFAIDVSAVAVETEALSSGLISNKNELTESIKVQARYNLILKQSQNVAGDFTNTNNELANSSRVLKAELENAGAELGQQFLPIAKNVVSSARDLVKGFNDLSEPTKKLIVGFAGVTAGIGPAIKGVLALKTAFTALSGPIGLVLTAITAVVAGITALKALDAEKQEKTFGSIAKSTGVASTDLKRIADISTGIITKSESIAEGFNTAQQMSGLTRKQLAEVLVVSGNLSPAQEKYIQTLTRTAKTSQELIQLSKDQTEALEAVKVEAVALSETQKNAYVAQNERVQEILNGNKSEIELIDEQIASITKLSLADSKFKDEQLEAVRILQAQKQAILDKERTDNEKAYQEKLKREIENNNAVYEIEKETEQKRIRDEEERVKRQKEQNKEILNSVLELSNAILQISANQATQQIADITSVLNANIESLKEKTDEEKAFDSFKESIQSKELERSISETNKKIADLKLLGDAESLKEAEGLQTKLDNEATSRDLDKKAVDSREARAKAIEDAEREASLKIYEIQVKQFEAQKAMSLIQVAINTAEGISKAIAQGGIFGAVTGAIAGGLGIAQAVAIENQPAPPRPQLATGAYIEGSARGTQVIVGENGASEEIFGMGSRGVPRRQQLANEVANVVLSKLGSTGSTTNFYSLVSVSDPQQLRQFAQAYEPYAEEYRGGRS